jgi:predicted ribosomally synthesized peptide with nif11-like leader
MSHQQEVEKFFHAVCRDKTLQDKLKAPCPANRHGFVNVAQESGYNFTTVDIDKYVRFYQFYKEFQAAIERYQSGSEDLSSWLKKWQKHIELCDRDLADDEGTIRDYLR